MAHIIPAVARERAAESSQVRVGSVTARQSAQVSSFEETPSIGIGAAPAIAEPLTQVQQARSAPPEVSAGSVEGTGVTVHRVRLGPEVQEIRVERSAGVQVGDHNRQLNQYQFKIERPHVSLDHLLEGHPARLHSFERLVANPDSRMANYAFRRHLSAGPELPSSRVLFADTSRAPKVRISAHVDECGATVVEGSRAVQVGDHDIQRNDFSYKLTGQEISLEQMLHDRPDLARGLAMTVRHPDNAAVQRSLTRQISDVYTRGSEPSLRILNHDLPGSRLSVEQGAGVQVGADNMRTDTVSVDIRRLALTGWDATAERIAAKIDGPDAVPEPGAPPVARPAPAPEISWQEPFRHRLPDPVEDLRLPDPVEDLRLPDPVEDLRLPDPVEDLGPSIDPFSF